MVKKIFLIILLASNLLCFQACNIFDSQKNIIGLPSQMLLAEVKPGEYQVEFLRKKQSASFIWLQFLKEQKLLGLATTLAGQSLFQLEYDAGKFKILKSLPNFKRKPLSYLMRDIFWATQSPELIKKINSAYPMMKVVVENEKKILFYEYNRLILEVQYLKDGIIMVKNHIGNYQLFLTPLPKEY